MNNKMKIAIGIAAVGAIAMFAQTTKKTKASQTAQPSSNYEGMLLYSEMNEWESKYIKNGVAYTINTAEAWSGLNRKVNLNEITLVVPDSVYKSIRNGGQVSNSGELIQAAY